MYLIDNIANNGVATIAALMVDWTVYKADINVFKSVLEEVKFVYKIRVTNEGELEGYATEITDFIPEGWEFLAEDNKAYGWVKEGDNKVTTRVLETVMNKYGEFKACEGDTDIFIYPGYTF